MDYGGSSAFGVKCGGKSVSIMKGSGGRFTERGGKKIASMGGFGGLGVVSHARTVKK